MEMKKSEKVICFCAPYNKIKIKIKIKYIVATPATLIIVTNKLV